MAKARRKKALARGVLRGEDLGLYEFANRLKKNKKSTLQRPPGDKATEETIKNYQGRTALLEVKESDGVFKASTHLICVLKEFDDETSCYYVQTYNGNGDPDGKPEVEERENLWVFPQIGETVQLTPNAPCGLVIKAYHITCGQVSLLPAPGGKKRAAASGKKPVPKKKQKKSPAKKKTNKVKAAPSLKTKKALDKVTTSTEENIPTTENKFTLDAVLKSFRNPRCLTFCLVVAWCLDRLFVVLLK